jgi:antitoxin (DNA-binding transcriptional repressor) of toxin-antitoxin stability system
MTSVGVRDLKNNLSKYLHLVKAGETIVITEHELVIAEIKKPSEFLQDSKKRAFAYFDEQSKIGKIKLAKRNNSQIESIVKKYLDKTHKMDWKTIHQYTRADRF